MSLPALWADQVDADPQGDWMRPGYTGGPIRLTAAGDRFELGTATRTGAF